MAFLKPPTWTREELAEASAKASDAFSESRKTEGLDYYLFAHERAAAAVGALLEETGDLLRLREEAPGLFSQGRLREVRYLSSPAISEDDLKTLAGVKSVSRSALSGKAEAEKALDIVLMNLDPFRFPWVYAGRAATSEERAAAVIATASLMASQETQTKRRSLARLNQENAVAACLANIGYREIGRRPVSLAADAPKSGEFCRESMVGGKKADVVIGMADGRFMALECKVSNSEVNSFKRLNHETVEKVLHWRAAFGANGVVGAAVLAGVFKVENLVAAQDEGVSIFWSQDLAALGAFLEEVRCSSG